jgi:hypothetical protein
MTTVNLVVPFSIKATLQTYDRDLDCQYIPEVGKICITHKKKPLWWIETEDGEPREVTFKDVDRILDGDTSKAGGSNRIVQKLEDAEYRMNVGRKVFLMDETRHIARDICRTAHKVISREHHGG